MAPTANNVRCWQCGKTETELKTLYDWESMFKKYQLDETKMRAKCRNTARKFCMTCAYDIINELDTKKDLASYLRRMKFISDAEQTMDLAGLDMRKYEDVIKKYTRHLLDDEWDKLKKSSQYEVIIGIILTYNHITFTIQLPIETKLPEEKTTEHDGRYFLDFVLPDYGLIIECDGSPYHKDDKKRDEAVLSIMTTYKIIRISADKIKDDPECVMQYIKGEQKDAGTGQN